MSFTKKEIKEIKYEKRFGYVFSVMILAFGALFILLFSVVQELSIIDMKIIGLIFFIIGLSGLVLYSMNRKLNIDLKTGKRKVEERTVTKKLETVDYEAGSGSLNVPILGSLFPKIWGQKMKKIEKFQIIAGNEKYDVDEKTVFRT